MDIQLIHHRPMSDFGLDTRCMTGPAHARSCIGGPLANGGLSGVWLVTPAGSCRPQTISASGFFCEINTLGDTLHLT